MESINASSAVFAVDEQERLRVLWRKLREVFSVENASHTLRFWQERKAGSVILRRVEKADRVRKGEDLLLGRTIDDPLACRILIGNNVAGAKLSGVRWELYNDFELTDLVGSGRFDQRDLLGGGSAKDVERLAQGGVSAVGDWDFDGLIALHQCVSCRHPYNMGSVIYVAGYTCKECGTLHDINKTSYLMAGLTRGFIELRARLPLMRLDSHCRFPIAGYVDPIPNSMMYWLLTTNQWSHLGEGGERIGTEGSWAAVKKAYDHSVFKLLTHKRLRDELLKYLRPADRDSWEVLIGALRRTGEVLSLPAATRYQDEFRLLGSTSLYVEKAFPMFINDVVLRYREVLTDDLPDLNQEEDSEEGE